MIRIGKIILLTGFCLLVSGLLLCSKISEDSEIYADITSFSEYVTGGKTADSAAVEMAMMGHEYKPEGIFGVKLGIAGFLGETERGPDTPQMVTSYEDYERVYGSYTGRSYMPYEVKGYFDNGGQALYIARVISQTAQIAQTTLKNGKINTCNLEAINGGEWGNRIAVRVTQGMESTPSDPTFRLEVFCFSYETFASMGSKTDLTKAAICEVFNDVSLMKDSPYYYKNIINRQSAVIRMSVEEDDDTELLPDTGEKLIWLAGGSDGDAPVLADFLGENGQDENATGLKGLEMITTISTLYSPVSCQYEGLNQALIDQCEALGDRIVVLDTAWADPHPAPWSSYISSYAACYSPWIQVVGFDSKEIMIPPGGLIAGTWVRNDYVKGPNRAPANEVVVGVNGVENEFSPQARKALSIRRINPITHIPGIGWITNEYRTLSELTDDYGYIHLRRYINYLRDSISTSLNWVTGREWDQDMQSRIKISIEEFLDREWNRGALIGSTQIEAYYVKVDCQETTEKHPVCIEVGVALTEPSQFFVFSLKK